MSLAYDYAYEHAYDHDHARVRARAIGGGARDADIVRLFAPVPARQVRLTRRGVLALAALVATVAAALVLLAWLNAPSGATAQGSSAPVTVRPGDTLWSIAQRIAPGRDPRAAVDDLRRINGLTGPTSTGLVPGQVLRTR